MKAIKNSEFELWRQKCKKAERNKTLLIRENGWYRRNREKCLKKINEAEQENMDKKLPRMALKCAKNKLDAAKKKLESRIRRGTIICDNLLKITENRHAEINDVQEQLTRALQTSEEEYKKVFAGKSSEKEKYLRRLSSAIHHIDLALYVGKQIMRICDMQLTVLNNYGRKNFM